MPEKDCPYWKAGQCTYREPPIGCTGHNLHVGNSWDSLSNCSQAIATIKKMIENEELEQLDSILTGSGEILRFFAKHLLLKAGEKS